MLNSFIGSSSNDEGRGVEVMHITVHKVGKLGLFVVEEDFVAFLFHFDNYK